MNCFVGNRNVVKVSNFDRARSMVNEEYVEAAQGYKFPIRWVPPEVMIHSKLSTKSDVWSFGEKIAQREGKEEKGRGERLREIKTDTCKYKNRTEG